MDLEEILLKEAEEGVSSKTTKKRKFYAGERTLEKELKNLDREVGGEDLMFSRETKRFDEVGGRSFMIGEGSDGHGIVGVWGEGG